RRAVGSTPGLRLRCTSKARQAAAFAGHSRGNEVPSIGTAGGIKDELEFSGPASCSAWLARLPLANISECHAALARQVNGMADAGPPASGKLGLSRRTPAGVQA